MTTKNEQVDCEKQVSGKGTPLLSFDEVSIDQEIPMKKVDSMVDIEEISAYMVASKSSPLFAASLANVGNFTMIFFSISRMTDDPYITGAIGLGNMTLNLLLRSYILGFNGSLITLLSQANGAGEYDLMGDIINRAKILWTLLMIPIMIFLYFIDHILAFFGQDLILATNTKFYVAIAMFGFISQLHFDIYRKVLNSQKLFKVHAPVPFISLFFH